MKTTKSLFIALASLSLFACSQEEIINNGQVAVEGNAALTLKINTESLSRAVGAATTDYKIKVTDKLVVRFLGSGVSETREVAFSDKITMYDVPEGTTGIVIVGNNKQTGNSYDDSFISTSAVESAKNAGGVTVYGSDLDLTANGTITNDESNLVYAKYEAAITLKPVTSRLEVGGITFKEADGTKLNVLTVTDAFINGAYMNGSFEKGLSAEKVTPSNPKYLTAQNIDADFSTYPLKDTFSDNNVLYDAIGDTEVASFPSNSNVIGYNFFVDNWGAAYGDGAGTAQGADTGQSEDAKRANLPKFTLKMNAAYTDGFTGPSPLYAVITKYKDNGGKEIKSFLPGKLYKIAGIELPEEALTPDPNGNQTIAVEATVTVQDWVPEVTTGEWAGQN